MAKSYAKKQSPKPKNGAFKQFVVMLASFLSGYLTATVFDFTSLSNWVNQHVVHHDNSPKQPTVATKPTDVPKPKFEFYTLLTKDNNATPAINRTTNTLANNKPASPTTVAATTPGQKSVSAQKILQAQTLLQTPGPGAVAEAKPVTTPTVPTGATNGSSKDAYVIQIASFNKRQDAENLKASLVLRGFDVNIAVASTNNINWFRVTIGPYASRLAAEKAQVMLARNEHMKGMIRKMDA